MIHKNIFETFKNQHKKLKIKKVFLRLGLYNQENSGIISR